MSRKLAEQLPKTFSPSSPSYPTTVMANLPLPPPSLVTLPVELLEFIILHLIPGTDPYDTFPSSYSASTRSDNLPPFRSADLIRLSRTCRRLHALATKALREERDHQQLRVNSVSIQVILGNCDKYRATSRRYGLAQKPSSRV